MKKMKLDKEEQEILDAYENGEFQSVPNVKKEIAKYREYAKFTLQKNKRINIRISSRDLIHIQRKAVEEGLPYQTLVSSILHKYVNGNFIEKQFEI
ncbi:MAG: antitoxin [Candidatus Firestonebacteria bacterium]|nr:antitoxin [Candidatus Firestonebacteria bacterium]